MRQVCNLAYAWLRADLVASLAMCDGAQRRRALDDFDLDLAGPVGGWGSADARLLAAIHTAE